MKSGELKVSNLLQRDYLYNHVTHLMIRNKYQVFLQSYKWTSRPTRWWHKLKVKVKLSLCLTKHHAMKTYREVEVQLHAFLTSALDGGEWSSSCLGRFTPREL